jgi:hypothetical protein
MLELAPLDESKRNGTCVPPCVKLSKRTSVVLVMSLVLGGANDIFAMSSDLKKASRDLFEDFIRVYESQSCLWRIKSKD